VYFPLEDREVPGLGYKIIIIKRIDAF